MFYVCTAQLFISLRYQVSLVNVEAKSFEYSKVYICREWGWWGFDLYAMTMFPYVIFHFLSVLEELHDALLFAVKCVLRAWRHWITWII